MSDAPVLYEVNEGIGTITLNRPNDGNRITRKMFLGLVDSFKKATTDRAVRVIILTCKGQDFCCGFDVSDPEASLNNNEEGSVSWEDRRENTGEEIELVNMLLNSPKPIIGVLRGRILGGGYFFAMCADCLVAADTTVMDNGEFALGMSYVNYTPFELWKLPMNIAKEKLFTGYPITAKEGFRLGLFNRVTTVDKVDEVALVLAKRMLKLAPYTLTMHKEFANMAYNNLKNMSTIVPFAKEVFSIALELPGTEENQYMWNYGRQNPGKLVDLFEEKLAELRKEELEELPHLDDLH